MELGKWICQIKHEMSKSIGVYLVFMLNELVTSFQLFTPFFATFDTSKPLTLLQPFTLAPIEWSFALSMSTTSQLVIQDCNAKFNGIVWSPCLKPYILICNTWVHTKKILKNEVLFKNILGLFVQMLQSKAWWIIF
jgi:hypothetical protein